MAFPAAISNMKKALTSGGVLLITMPQDKAAIDRQGADGRWINLTPLETQVAIAEEAGLEVIAIEKDIKIYNGVWSGLAARKL